MSDGQRLLEYRDYYRARAGRYAANPLYPATAAAERALADAVEAATSMEDLQQRVISGGLALDCGKALARDQAQARAQMYARTDETVRAQAPAEVLDGLDDIKDAAALVALTAGAQQRAGQAITSDEMTRLWSMSLTTLDNVEMWEHARVPDRWRNELAGYARDAVDRERGAWSQVEAQAQTQCPGWQFSGDLARAPRHRRLIPVPDNAFEARLSLHRSVVRGAAG
jgi:hypothetical protein